MNIIRDYFEVQGKPLPQNIDPFAFASMFYPGTERISSYEQVRGVPIKFSLQCNGIGYLAGCYRTVTAYPAEDGNPAR